MATLTREVEKTHRTDERCFELHGVWPRRWVPSLRWDQVWRDRAYTDRLVEQRGRKVSKRDFDAEKQRLLAIPSAEYAERLLAPDWPRRGRAISCPFHDERTPSCNLTDTRWHCFGCGEGGSIYDFAGHLWDLVCRGQSFVQIHDRLLEVFP